MTPTPPDRLERHALLMLIASLSGHVGNYVFHSLTGRLLPLADYGLMIAVLGALQILHLPLTALNMAVAQHTAAHPKASRALLAKGSRLLLILSLLVSLILWMAQVPLLTFFSSDRSILLPLAAILIALSLFLTLTGGLLQGHQKFRWLAARSLSLFLLRALFCLVLLLAVYPAAELALLAHLLAMLATLAVSLTGIRHCIAEKISGHASRLDLMPVGLQTLKALPALAGFAVLMSADVVLVRRYFSPETSGRFAQAAVLARMVLWLPLPIASAMYPKVITPGTAARHTLRKAAAYTGALLLLTLAGFWLTAPLLLNLLYGTANPEILSPEILSPELVSPELVSWTRHMALAMAPLAFTHVLLQYDLAQKRFVASGVLLLMAFGYLAAVALHHPTIESLIKILLLTNSISAIALSSHMMMKKSQT